MLLMFLTDPSTDPFSCSHSCDTFLWKERKALFLIACGHISFSLNDLFKNFAPINYQLRKKTSSEWSFFACSLIQQWIMSEACDFRLEKKKSISSSSRDYYELEQKVILFDFGNRAMCFSTTLWIIIKSVKRRRPITCLCVCSDRCLNIRCVVVVLYVCVLCTSKIVHSPCVQSTF